MNQGEVVTMYVRLARREEREVEAEFGETYRWYAAVTPGFIPRLGATPAHTSGTGGMHHEA